MPDVPAAVDQVAAALGSTGTVEVAHSDTARVAAYCITAVEGRARHLPMLRSRAADFDPATRSRLIAGAMLPASIVSKAHDIRRDHVGKFDDLFETVDVLLAPATPCTAPFLADATAVRDSEACAVRRNLGLYTQPISFVGLPVVVVPVHLSGEMLAGVQIITLHRREDRALAVAAALERVSAVSAPIAKLTNLETAA